MNHFLNVAVAAATIGAMASVDKIDLATIDIIDDGEDGVKEARDVFNSPLVRNVFVQNFEQLVHSVHKEELRLSEIYASTPQTSGRNDALLKDFKSGTQNVAGGSGYAAKMPTNAKCHSQCHSQCHSNHSSRGWR
ncbi:hypothetical protein OTK49_26635 [Vibrio coralliirubri]|uniref:hypothetical protein n=1 Tax=Vibrio coralliirubri TaxID=1516159 RepID=UPI002283B90F|nr:hypothetical protein [Vibrio coralliirubri]MCY9866118.1 hypothetical protein [Vibrio coralliirubri]